MSTDYWPWWLGGTALALIAVSHPLFTGRPLGVSGVLARLLRPGRAAACSVPVANPEATQPYSAPSLVPEIPESESTPTPQPEPPPSASRSKGRIPDLLFLGGMVAGGALSRWIETHQVGGATLSPEFQHRFGTGLLSFAVLFVGGALVGFGTRWSGGCTSGHGLSGVGRLHPSSLLATATFFGVAIAVSFLLDLVIH